MHAALGEGAARLGRGVLRHLAYALLAVKVISISYYIGTGLLHRSGTPLLQVEGDARRMQRRRRRTRKIVAAFAQGRKRIQTQYFGSCNSCVYVCLVDWQFKGLCLQTVIPMCMYAALGYFFVNCGSQIYVLFEWQSRRTTVADRCLGNMVMPFLRQVLMNHDAEYVSGRFWRRKLYHNCAAFPNAKVLFLY